MRYAGARCTRMQSKMPNAQPRKFRKLFCKLQVNVSAFLHRRTYLKIAVHTVLRLALTQRDAPQCDASGAASLPKSD
jgi:hypothetical protein